MALEDPQLVSLYLARGLLTDAETPVHLPTQCPRHDTCWASEEPRRPSGHPAAELSSPWIGPRYSAGRLVVVLENLRDFGGWDLREEGAASGMRWLAALARSDWTVGRRRLFRTKEAGHGGTNVWAQAVGYAATWLSVAGLLAKSWPGDVVPTKTLAETIDQIAMVQHVKCSPLGNRSNPNDSMWAECGRHVLREELAILRPDRLLVVGNHHNAEAMRARVLSGETSLVAERTVMLGARRSALRLERAQLSGHPLDMAVVQHPASPGGTSRKLVAAFRELVDTG